MDIKVICVNNLIYAMTGGQTAPTTPFTAITTTAPYGCFEPSFNLCAAGRSGRGVLRGALDHLPRAAAHQVHVRDLAQARVLLHRGALALPHALPAPQQDGRRPGHHEVLQGEEQDPPRRAHRRSGAEQGRRDRGGQVRGPRAARLHGIDARPAWRSSWASATWRWRVRYASDRDSHRRVWRPGRDPVRHGDRQGRLDFRGRSRHHDPEFRPRGPRRRVQRPGGALRPAHPLSLRHAARRAGGDVAGGLLAIHAGAEGRRHPDRRAGAGADLAACGAASASTACPPRAWPKSWEGGWC